jgi:hypothetical protein
MQPWPVSADITHERRMVAKGRVPGVDNYVDVGGGVSEEESFMWGRARTRHRPTRRSVVRWVLPTMLLGVLVVGLAAPAQAADPTDCTPMGDPACRDLTAVVDCVWQNPDGTRTVVWGYDNPSTTTLRIDPGNKNGMSPGADDQGQPQQFEPGLHMNVFTTTISGSTAQWHLGNSKVSISGSSPACATKPVSIVGSMAALGVFAALVAVAVMVAFRPRRRFPAVRPERRR